MFPTVGGRAADEAAPDDGIVVVEDPCPHGIPDWLCADLCVASELPSAEATAVVDLDRAPGALLALECQTAGSLPELLSEAQVLDVVEGTEQLLRWASGLRVRMLAEFADRHPSGTSAAPPGADAASAAPVSRWVPDEVGLTLGVSRLEALGLIAQAQRFTHILPDTLEMLEQGRIDLRRAEAIAHATAVLPDDKARAVEAAVLPRAAEATLRQVRDRVRRAIARVDPDGEYRRHREANTQRRVSIRSLDDGMASLWFYGSAEQIEAAWQMADRLARALGAEDPRTLDQRRFDLALQVLQGRLTVTDLSDVDAAVSSVLAATPSGAGQPAPDPDPTARASEAHDTGNGPIRPDATGSGSTTGSDTSTGSDTTGSDTTDSGCDSGCDCGCDTGTDTEAGCDRVVATAASDRDRSGPGVPVETLVEAVARALARRPDTHAAARKPLIQVVVGLDTVLGGDRPAELIGHGPISATTARALAAGEPWARLVSDPLSGTLLDHGRTTYAPPTGLSDHVRARDQVCRGPHCTRRIQDLDHHVPWGKGGPTRESNLYGFCKHHHLLKDAPGWQVLAHPDRSLTWISPCGRRHTTGPYDYRRFTDEPPTGAGPDPTGSSPNGTPAPGVLRPPPERPGHDDEQPPF